MSSWFADTFFFLALLNREDEAHSRAVEIISRLRTDLLTTVWVLVEVADGVSAPEHRSSFVALMTFLRSHKRVTILPADQEVFDEGFELYAQRQDKAWSLTDCISFVVMKQHGVTEALTGDRHFEQAGFTTLLR